MEKKDKTWVLHYGQIWEVKVIESRDNLFISNESCDIF